MKKFCVLVGLLFLANVSAHAQINAVKVVEKKDVPQAIRARVPKNGKTLFYGACRLPPSNREVLVHYYRASPIILTKAEDMGSPGIMRDHWKQIFRLDVFSKTGRGKRSRYVRLNSSDIVNEGEGDGQNDDASDYPGFRVIADFLWVVPKRRKIPILRLNLAEAADEYTGPHNKYFLFSFPKGLKGKTKAWYAGYYHSQDEINEFPSSNDYEYSIHGDPNHGIIGRFEDKIRFDKLDKRGYTMITQSHLRSSLPEYHETDFRWLGDRFGDPKRRDLPMPSEKK